MENGETTFWGIIYWTMVAGTYWVLSFVLEPLRHPMAWPLLLSAIVVWIFLLRIPFPVIFRIMITGTSLFVIWYSFGFVPGF